MAEAQTEDDAYLVSSTVDEFAVADEDALDDDEIDELETDQVVNRSIIEEIQQYVKEAIVEEDSIDQIDLTETAKMTPTQQIAVHKLVKNYLVQIQTIINDKIKEK